MANDPQLPKRNSISNLRNNIQSTAYCNCIYSHMKGFNTLKIKLMFFPYTIFIYNNNCSFTFANFVVFVKLQEEIRVLKLELDEKVKELADVKDELGITTYDELKESLSYGWKVLGDKWKGLQETEKLAVMLSCQDHFISKPCRSPHLD